MKIRYTRRARIDLSAISDYLRDQAPEAAARVSSAIQHRVSQLANHPYLGRPGPEPGVRSLTIGRYPYPVSYRVEQQEIRIIHVRHQRRAPWRGER